MYHNLLFVMYMCNAALLLCDFKYLQAWPEITLSSNIN